MAITNNGTKVTVPADKLPSGYTLPTVTTFTDYEYYRTATLTVDRATVYSATKTTTMANILADASIGVTKQVTDLVTADFIGSQTVTIYTDLYDIDTNLNVSQTGDFYSNVVDKFVCHVRIYVKSV
jgi:hypothetical protein